MYKIKHTFQVKAPIERVFAYYGHPENVVRASPDEINLRIIRAELPLGQGSRVVFSTRPSMIPFEVHWMMEVRDFRPPHGFTDRLVKGPFAFWEHSHQFEAIDDETTRIVDRIRFGSPNIFLDKMVGSTYVRHKLADMIRTWEAQLREAMENSPSHHS